MSEMRKVTTVQRIYRYLKERGETDVVSLAGDLGLKLPSVATSSMNRYKKVFECVKKGVPGSPGIWRVREGAAEPQPSKFSPLKEEHEPEKPPTFTYDRESRKERMIKRMIAEGKTEEEAERIASMVADTFVEYVTREKEIGLYD